MPASIYLDSNATTPLSPGVAEAMGEALRSGYANPASQHEAGRRARRVLEESRERIVELLGGVTTGRQPDRLVFTSGGTEANNLAIHGMAGIADRAVGAATPAGRMITSPIEHPSVAEAAKQLLARGWQLDYLPVDTSGTVAAEALPELLVKPTRLVSVMLGNNETGVLQPIAELANHAAVAGVAMHTDAVQAVGKQAVAFRELGVTMLSFTAHKFHGPLGIGGLLMRGDTEIAPQLFGGFQQAGIRPGTESVPLVVGMHTALEEWHAERHQREQRLAELRDRFEQSLLAQVPTALVVSYESPRLPHTSNVAFVGFDRQALFLALDMEGIACSTGSACASGSSEPSPVLVAMGLADEQIRGSLRFSLGAHTTTAEIDEATRRISNVCKRLEKAVPGRK